MTKIIPWNKGRRTGPLPKSHRDKISLSMLGKNTWTLGRIRPQEEKDRISLKLKGIKRKPFTREHREKLRQSTIKSLTPERILFLREIGARKGRVFRNTKPEKLLEEILVMTGFSFRKQKLINRGREFWHRVDFFIEPDICIEMDGCYYHGCSYCYNSENLNIIQRNNIERDTIVNNELKNMNYKVIRIYSHELSNKDQVAQKIGEVYDSVE